MWAPGPFPQENKPFLKLHKGPLDLFNVLVDIILLIFGVFLVDVKYGMPLEPGQRLVSRTCPLSLLAFAGSHLAGRI